MDRRKPYLDKLEHQVGTSYQDIVLLTRDCLDVLPDLRPTSQSLLRRVKSVKAAVEKVQGTSVVKKTDICRVLLTREMTEKEKRIGEFEVSYLL